MPTYTLYYFNGRGRAEVLRMIFTVAGVKFMDKRFEFSEWDRYRNDMPGMCVPVLEMDKGLKMPETMAIARYLAREFGLYGKNNMDMFKIDYICDCLYEILHDYMRYYHWKNGRFRTSCTSMKDSALPIGDMSKSDSYLQSRYVNTCNRVLPFLERILNTRTGSNQFFMGDQVLLCDVMCYCCLESPYLENQAMLTKYPKLMSLWKRVAAHPKITSYLKNRCSTIW